MDIKTVKKPPKRIDLNYLRRFNLQTYGDDNLYPQNLQLVTRASGTAELCISRYAKFIEGFGFGDERTAALAVDAQGTKADALLHDIALDVARFGGFAIHVNYNVLGRISSLHFVPFENCRLEEADDDGNVSHIAVHPDWTGARTRNGKRLLVTEDNIERFPIFNPDPIVVAQQIENAGGIAKYKGQVMWCSLSGKDTYPTPVYDSALTEISTDCGLGNVKYRNVRENFLVSCMLITRKNAPTFGDDGQENDYSSMISKEDLRDFQGDENTGKLMLVELENAEEKPEIVEFPTKNFDKEYEVTESSVIERIYAQFHQELFYAIRIGKLGFSGDVMKDAYSYYAGEVTYEQRYIERAFAALAAYWHDPIPTLSFSIQPLKFISAETNETNE